MKMRWSAETITKFECRIEANKPMHTNEERFNGTNYWPIAKVYFSTENFSSFYFIALKRRCFLWFLWIIYWKRIYRHLCRQFCSSHKRWKTNCVSLRNYKQTKTIDITFTLWFVTADHKPKTKRKLK